MNKILNVIAVTSFFILSLISLGFSEDTLTITTYYPSPYGSYRQLQAYSLGVGDNNNSGSLDNGDIPPNPGDVWIRGSLSIGTTNTGNTLYVNGGIRVVMLAAASATTVCRDGSNDLSTCSSSKKFKDNIAYLKQTDEQNILKDIKQTRIAKFKMKTENNNVTHVGIIAEESPKNLQFIDEHNNANIDLLSAQLGYTWAAIKALDRRIEQLEKENQKLKLKLRISSLGSY